MKIVDLSPTQEILEYTNWSGVFHAYGVATDTPQHLRALLGNDERAIAEALEHLFVATTHQGDYYPAAEPAALFVIAALDELNPQEIFYEQLRSDLLDWLRFAGESFYGKPHAAHEVITQLLNLKFTSPTDYLELTRVLVAWTKRCQSKQLRRKVRNRLRAELDTWLGNIIRWPLIDALGTLGHSVSRYLNDPDPIVQAFAAIHTHNKKGTRTLNRSLARITTWDPHYPVEVLRPLVCELIARAQTIEDVLPAAMAVMRHGNFRNMEWHELLTFACKDRANYPNAYRKILKALVENDTVWVRPRSSGLIYRLEEFGLPQTRAELRGFLTSNHQRKELTNLR